MAIGEVHRRLVGEGGAFADRVRLIDAGDTLDTLNTGDTGDTADRADRSGGIGVEELAAQPGLVQQLIDGQGRRLERAYGVRFPTYVLATRVLHDYAWPAALVVSAPWFLEGVVPVPAPGDLRVEPESGLLLVRTPRTVRPGEPATVREVVADHHRPLVEALGPVLRRGPRAAWGTVADDLLSGVWWLGRLLDVERRAVAAAEALLPTPSPPFPGRADFREIVDADGATHLTRTRVACCLRYVAEPDACLTCPRVADAERRVRLAAG